MGDTMPHAFEPSRRNLLAACGAAAAATALTALAQGKPTVRLVQGYAPGGFIDVSARILAEAVAPLVGEPVIVDARPGANGGIAASFVASSKADGTTWLLTGLPHITNSAIGHAQPWSVDDFSGACFVSRQPSIAVAHPALGVKTLQELVALSKKSPGKLNFLNGGDGTVSHLTPEMLNFKYGASLTAVPYKGAAPGMSDLLTGRLQFGVLFPSVVAEYIASGKLVALATADEARFAGLPQVPTFAEAGFSDAFVSSRWYVLLPAKTPPALVNDISEKIQRALADAKVRAQLEQLGMTIASPSRPAEVDQYIRTSVSSWKSFFKESGLKFN